MNLKQELCINALESPMRKQLFRTSAIKTSSSYFWQQFFEMNVVGGDNVGEYLSLLKSA